MVRAVGLVLAAGEGSRFGQAKATVVDADGTSWLRRAVETLRDGGCARVLVVLGASAEAAAAHLDGVAGAVVVVAEDWSEGLSASLRSGLAAAARLDPAVEVLVITLVDLPDIGPEVVARLLASARSGGETLLRATYDDRAGHPVVIGRRHWAALGASVSGDRGAAAYLDAHRATTVDCGDLATGLDVDTR